MNKIYDKIIWHNNTTPALMEDNLNAMSEAIDGIDDRVVDLAGTIMEDVPQIQAYLEQADDLVEAMETLSQNPPYIGTNGNWYVWNTAQQEYVDSGIDASITVQVADVTMLAEGASPYVTNTGTNTDPIFHLFIPIGATGATGQTGPQGKRGSTVAMYLYDGPIDPYSRQGDPNSYVNIMESDILAQNPHLTSIEVGDYILMWNNLYIVSNIKISSTSSRVVVIIWEPEAAKLKGAKGDTGDTGATGATGADGFSPAVTVTDITGGHRVNITDASHPSGQNFDVMDGEDGASDWSEITNKPNFASVATSGSYSDLSNKPTIPAAQVNSDWNASSGVAQILNKPTIPDVSGKADKVSGATNGNFAGLDSNGNLTDSGKKASDFKGASVHDSWSEVTGKPFTSIASDAGLIVNNNNALSAKYTKIAMSGTAAYNTPRGQYIEEIDASGTISKRVISGSEYLKATTKTTSGGVDTFTFTRPDFFATSDVVYEIVCNKFGVFPTGCTISATGTCTVTFDANDNVTECRIYQRL